MHENDFPAHFEFSNWLQKQQNEKKLFSHILFCGEDTFMKDGIFNMRNAHLLLLLVILLRKVEHKCLDRCFSKICRKHFTRFVRRC